MSHLFMKPVISVNLFNLIANPNSWKYYKLQIDGLFTSLVLHLRSLPFYILSKQLHIEWDTHFYLDNEYVILEQKNALPSYLELLIGQWKIYSAQKWKWHKFFVGEQLTSVQYYKYL